MKHASLFALVLAACVTTPEDAPTPASDPAPTIHPDICTANLNDHTTSEPWTTDLGAEDLWPTGCGITSTQIIRRKGPTNPINGADTFIAFVVWNDSVVGHIYTVDIGANGGDFGNTINGTFAARLNTSPDHYGGAGGGTDAGTPPIPTPHVDYFTVNFSQYFLDNAVKPASASITHAMHDVAGMK